MKLDDMIDLLNHDLRREYSHWHFYMQAAIMVTGLNREELSEFFLEEAAGEMKHIEAFGRMIRGLGGIPATTSATFQNTLTAPKDLLLEALRMEKEVVQNYTERQDQATQLEENGGEDKINGRRINLFLDEQILDSVGTVDNIKEMLKY